MLFQLFFPHHPWSIANAVCGIGNGFWTRFTLLLTPPFRLTLNPQIPKKMNSCELKAPKINMKARQ